MLRETGILATLWVGLGAGMVGAQEERVLRGRVLDTATGAGIANVHVEVVETSAVDRTDRDGRFLLTRLPGTVVTLRVSHPAYGTHEQAVRETAGVLEIGLAPLAFLLDSMTVHVLSSSERQRRARGFTRNLIRRPDIEQSIPTSRHLGDVLRGRVPSIRVTEARNLAGADVCIEFRGANQSELFQVGCNAPKVYLDGIPVSSPVDLFTNLSLEQIEEIEVVPPSEAGVQYGTGALHGVLLIRTRRPGRVSAEPDGRFEAAAAAFPAFDWAMDPEGHDWTDAALRGTVGNLVGVGVGVAVAGICIEMNERDEIDSRCGVIGTLAAGLSAVAAPAALSAWGTGRGGRTGLSQGRFWPAAAAAGMALAPGYAFALTQRRGGGAARVAGHTLLVLGAPLLATLADRWFRRLR